MSRISGYVENEEIKNLVINNDVDKILELIPDVPRELMQDYCNGYNKETDEDEKKVLLFCIESMHIRKVLDIGNIDKLIELIPELNYDEALEYCERYKELHDSEIAHIMNVLYYDAEYNEMCNQTDNIVLDLLNKTKKSEKRR